MPQQREGSERPSYRPDVDGLRAVAVLLVMADHFGIRLRGGYVGVDIFFVISGYLISGIILSELAANRFSIVRFYERRVRRIFPALLVVLAVVTVFVDRLFWHQAGYFDEASFIKPLLHTWSLAVEEQFYILFPIFLVAVRRFMPKRLKPAILAITAISFAAAVITVRNDATAAFYFAPLRAWELLFGTIVSQRYIPAIRGVVARNAASFAGMAMIAVPALVYTSRTEFPGLAALPPCLGAALIIAAGETGTSLVGRLLSLRPVVFIGLISYSVYLWHWPILVFERTSSILPVDIDSTRGKLILIALSLVIGWLSWLAVEQPFRTGRFRPSRSAVFTVNGVAAAVMALVGAGIIATHGLPNRFPPDAQAVAAYTDYYKPAFFREGTCFLTPSNTFADFRADPCLTTHPGRRSILLAGDSHAAQLWPGFSAEFPSDDILQANVSGCHPLLVQPETAIPLCRQLTAFLFDNYLLHHPPDILVLSARWDVADEQRLDRTIDFAHAHHIDTIVIGPSIEYDAPLPRMLAIALRNRRPFDIDRHLVGAPRALDNAMAALAQTRWHVPYISVYKDLCEPQCPVYAAPLVPLLLDGDHLTAAGSILLAKAIQANHELTVPATAQPAGSSP